MHAQPVSVATDNLVCCDFAPSEYCIMLVSKMFSLTTAPSLKLPHAVSECQLMASIVHS